MPEGPSHAKRGRGIVTWLVVAGTILFLGFVAVVGVLVSNPKVRKFVSLASKSHDLATAGESAPGAAEVRLAGKCQVATVEDLDEAAAIDREIEDGGAPSTKLEGKIVVCIVGALADPPACDALANAYVDAAHPTTLFFVGVKKMGAEDMACNETYDALGNRISKKKKKKK